MLKKKGLVDGVGNRGRYSLVKNWDSEEKLADEKHRKNKQKLKEILDFHCGAIVVGAKISGKT